MTSLLLMKLPMCNVDHEKIATNISLFITLKDFICHLIQIIEGKLFIIL